MTNPSQLDQWVNILQLGGMVALAMLFIYTFLWRIPQIEDKHSSQMEKQENSYRADLKETREQFISVLREERLQRESDSAAFQKALSEVAVQTHDTLRRIYDHIIKS